MNYAFIDVETGGVHSDVHAVLQVGCLIVNEEFDVVESFNTLVRTK